MAKTEILSPAVRVKINNEWVELPALKGEKGDAASTIRVGEVRSGSTASVVNSGTVNDVVLDFVLPKGDRGLQGIQGERGLQGEPGPKGDKGDKGDRGERGMQGIQGKQGLQGIQGEKGEKGDKGDKGDRGLQGIQGDPLTWDDLTEEQKASLKGEQGEPGPRGEQGIQGQDAPVFTFKMGDITYIERLDQTFFNNGYLIVNGEKNSSYTPRAYYQYSNYSDWHDANRVELIESGIEAVFQGKDIRAIRFDFYDGEKLVYSHYIQIPKDGKDGQNGKDGINGIDGKDAPVYTFEVESLYWDTAGRRKVLYGYLVVNGEKKSDYEVKGYYKTHNKDSWLYRSSYSWETSNNRLLVMFSGSPQVSQEKDIKEIRLDFLKDGLVVYSHYIQIPQNGEQGLQGPKGDKGGPLTWADLTDEQKASLKGEKGEMGQDAPVYTFEVEELYLDEAVNYTFLKGSLVVTGEKSGDYVAKGYCRRVSRSSWESALECQISPSDNKLLAMFRGHTSDGDIKEIRLDFSKNGSVVYSYYMQIPKDGKTGEAATVQVGTVTEGDTVSVVNVGDEHNAILNFTLKKGKDYEIEVRDGLALVESGYNLNEARTAIGIEDLGGESFENGSTHKYRFPILEVGDVVYFVIPYNGGNKPITFYFYLPSEGKYIVDDDPRGWSDGFRRISSVYYNPKTLHLSVKLQRYE